MKASVNYVGNSSDYRHSRGIREYPHRNNKHCNSPTFTMVSKDKDGKNEKSQAILSI
jgi:acyl-CoA hydrolase